MTKARKKRVVVIFSLIAALFVVEMVREEVSYLFTSSGYEHGYWRLQKGMTKETVKEALGEPDAISKFQAAPEETWRWEAYQHRGWLWKHLHLAAAKGHYNLTVTFDNQGQVSDFYSSW